jgi:type IV pilus biogenesis protein CpaD/CtpE
LYHSSLFRASSLAVVIALASIGIGCAKRDATEAKPQKTSAKTPMTEAQSKKASAELQMSLADYKKNRRLGHQVYLTHTISDADLDWTLNLLSGAKNFYVRARAMTILEEVHPMSAAQKAKIAPAIAPYLNSTNALEQSCAQKVKLLL